MRLTLVISALVRAGAERVASILASAWAQQGKEVTLLSLDRGEPAFPIHPRVKLQKLDLNAPSRNLYQGLTQNLHRVRVLRRAIREAQPDIVIAFLDHTNVLTLLATRRLRARVIVTEHIDPSHYNIGTI